MKKSEMQAEIERLWRKLDVLQERVAILESQQRHVYPVGPYQPYWQSPVTCEDKTTCGS